MSHGHEGGGDLHAVEKLREAAKEIVKANWQALGIFLFGLFEALRLGDLQMAPEGEGHGGH